MITATIFEAKTKLSELIRQVQAGENVTITSGRDRTPVARLEPIEERKPKRLGAMLNPDFVLPDAFWEPLTDEECGLGDDPLLQTPPDQTK